MKKRHFRLTVSGNGGEIAIGRIKPDFVDFWFGRDADDLAEHVRAVFCGDAPSDPDSPDLTEIEPTDPLDICDIYHRTMPYSDSTAVIQEIAIHPDAELLRGTLCWRADKLENQGEELWAPLSAEEEVELENVLYGSEAMLSEFEAEAPDLWGALIYNSISRGTFYEAIIETGAEGFDKKYLRVATVDTDMGEFIERIWYAHDELRLDYVDTIGLGSAFQVGWWNPLYQDHTTDEEIKEALDHADLILAEDDD